MYLQCLDLVDCSVLKNAHLNFKSQLCIPEHKTQNVLQQRLWNTTLSWHKILTKSETTFLHEPAQRCYKMNFKHLQATRKDLLHMCSTKLNLAIKNNRSDLSKPWGVHGFLLWSRKKHTSLMNSIIILRHFNGRHYDACPPFNFDLIYWSSLAL